MTVLPGGDVIVAKKDKNPNQGGKIQPLLMRFSVATKSFLWGYFFDFDYMEATSLRVATLPNGDIIMTGDQSNTYYGANKPYIFKFD